MSHDPSLLWDVEAKVNSIAILPGGGVICACGAGGLRVYDKKSGQKIEHPISDICKRNMRSVAVCDDGATVAAVERSWSGHDHLHIYTSVNDSWEHQMYDTCEGPLSVACTDDRHFIVGSNNNSIYKYNAYGLQIWEKKLSFWPQYICTDHKKRILVSNTYGGCVTVYNEAGVEMFSFPAATDQKKQKHGIWSVLAEHTQSDQRKPQPRGLCVDDEDNILVVDWYSKSVLLFDPRGQFLKKLVDIEKGDPVDVALFKNTHMASLLYHGSGSNVCLYKL